MAYGQLYVDNDPTMWAKKIVYTASNLKVAHAISDELLDHSHIPVDHLVKNIAQQMAKYYEKDIEELLLAQFAQKTPQASPHGWNSAPMGDIKAGISEMSQMLATGGVIHAEKQQAHGVLNSLLAVVPGLKGARARCPECKKTAVEDIQVPERKLSDVIIDLNDNHKWTREQIADWLETLDVDLSFVPPEDALPPAPEAHDKIDLDVISWDDWQKDKAKQEMLAQYMAVPIVQDPKAFASLITGI